MRDEKRLRFTGYGRGWSEERAPTRIGRLLQKLREPATTIHYVIALIIIPVLVTAAAVVAALTA